MERREIDEQIPLDAVHQFAYCPRRSYLMYHDGLWEANYYTEDGLRVHNRVDSEPSPLPEPVEDGDPVPNIARSVQLGSLELGISSKLDLVEIEDGTAVPVEFKRGAPPDNDLRSWPPERIQLMSQGLLLREAGYNCDKGILYYQQTRRRIEVIFSPELEQETHDAIKKTHRVLVQKEPPAPFVDSPKCVGCSLGGICMPDETNVLLSQNTGNEIRRLYPARDNALPMYVQEQGAYIGKSGDGLSVKKGGKELVRIRFLDMSQLVICGNIQITSQAIHSLAESDIPILHLSRGFWFYGITSGFGLKNAFIKSAQFSFANNEKSRLDFAKSIVKAKIMNQRTLLQRNGDKDTVLLKTMKRLAEKVDGVESNEILLGIEGAAAAQYFSSFGAMLNRDKEENIKSFDFTKRNRRPPKDPINAMLSFGYAILTKDCTVALTSAGLDPYWGFYHEPRHGRPALALDLMEEFRPLIVDSAVITAINTGMVRDKDFTYSAGACSLDGSGRKAFLRAYESRMDQLITHPVFDYRLSWRRVILVQARLIARLVCGQIGKYPSMVTR